MPYWLPLALFRVTRSSSRCQPYRRVRSPVRPHGVTVEIWYGIAVPAFICVYQQIENLIFAPKDLATHHEHQRRRRLPPCSPSVRCSALGAFWRRRNNVPSIHLPYSTPNVRFGQIPLLMNDPVPEKKSVVVEG